ncbi:hypothetical protein E2C01_014670 [Portunus trituberculatus]|uniref:Uncharacterized protein n=1 Tax=Portunus trituberculatus TaxID=210409 RepID=A0A5B7DKU2_PORTR|nr:hypothetical protein [Portunus trituberculatus]
MLPLLCTLAKEAKSCTPSSRRQTDSRRSASKGGWYSSSTSRYLPVSVRLEKYNCSMLSGLRRFSPFSTRPPTLTKRASCSSLCFWTPLRRPTDNTFNNTTTVTSHNITTQHNTNLSSFCVLALLCELCFGQFCLKIKISHY